MKELDFWSAIGEILEVLNIRFKATDVEIEAMKYRIQRLEHELQELRNSQNKTVGDV